MKNLALILCALVIGLLGSLAHADIIYEVNRNIGSGTITGYIRTDGTLGNLTSENIVYWELALSAPNLETGSPDFIHPHTETVASIAGLVVTATPTSLLFNISGSVGIGHLYFEGENRNFWCLETVFADCTGAGKGEHMGKAVDGSVVAQSAQRSGTFVFASVVAPIVYQVNRAVGAGTVTGFIKTDGKLGALADANILDWELTLHASNLNEGPTDTIGSATLGHASLIGLGTTATATELSFDITGLSGISSFSLEGEDNNFWCIESPFAQCTGAGTGEHLGRNSNGTAVAQTASRAGQVVIARVPTPIRYHVNRTIGAGTITGYIETDGTLGALLGNHITGWALTLNAPNLAGGPTNTITSDTNNFITRTSGSTITATPTSLLFDISGLSGVGFVLFRGQDQSFWCIETASAGCTGTGIGEHMGLGDGVLVAQTGHPVGSFAFARTCLADLNDDGSLNFFDVSAFLSAFAAMNPLGDLNGDGAYNFFDVSAFLAAFAAGCP